MLTNEIKPFPWMGATLLLFRTATRLDRKQFGRVVGIDPAAIHYYEEGYVSLPDTLWPKLSFFYYQWMPIIRKFNYQDFVAAYKRLGYTQTSLTDILGIGINRFHLFSNGTAKPNLFLMLKMNEIIEEASKLKVINIHEMLAEAGTQYRLAKQLGLNRDTVNRWIRGNREPQAKTVERNL